MAGYRPQVYGAGAYLAEGTERFLNAISQNKTAGLQQLEARKNKTEEMN